MTLQNFTHKNILFPFFSSSFCFAFVLILFRVLSRNFSYLELKQLLPLVSLSLRNL